MGKEISLENTCTLCQTDLPKFPIFEEGNSFCCHGCQVVFKILFSKQQLENYRESSIFKQALEAGLISNPELLDQIRQQKQICPDEERQKIYLEILDMWCPSCAEVIRLILLQEKGVIHCVVDYATDLASIEFSPRHLSKEKLYEIISSLGYAPHALEESQGRKVSRDLYLRFGIAAFCSLNAMMFSYPLYATYFDSAAYEDGKIFAWLTFISSIPVVTYCMVPIAKRFFHSLRVGLIGMEALVMSGVTAAMALSIYELWKGSNQVYFDSMTVIITLMLLGKIIETKAKFSSKEALFRLTKSLPRRGRKRFLDGSSAFISIKEIQTGDLLVAHAGEKIVLDGEVVEGEGSCDESFLTGESIPVSKQLGAKVLEGSILKHGSLVFRASYANSTLQKILTTVEGDLDHKLAYTRAADSIVRWFVPVVLLLSFFTAFIGWALNSEAPFLRAISILLIACPCAIGIAAPLAESHLLQRLIALGVIVRNRGCLSLLPSISLFVFDKTGTVTEGKFCILDGLQRLSIQDKSLLKGLCNHSNHPICQALYDTLEEDAAAFEKVEEFTGKGMRGHLHNVVSLLGSAQLFNENGIVFEEQINKHFSTVYFSPDSKTIFPIYLGDKIRSDIPELIKNLKTKTVLLSGDQEHVVAAVASHCQFDEYFAGVHPLQKRDYIEKMRKNGEIVCMVGDGINDAPSLTAAQIGISVVSASDISIQVSDILLTTDKLNILSKMLFLAAYGKKILHQNLFWAFFYNIIGIGLAIAGLLSPLFAAFAMTISSLIVLFNSKRI